MIIKMKRGEEYIDVDTELSTEEIDTFEKKDDRDLEDTLELKLDIEGVIYDEGRKA